MAGTILVKVKRKDPVFRRLKKHVEGLLKGKTPKHSLTYAEIHTPTTTTKIRKFVCGWQGNIWEVWWLSDTDEFTPPILTGDELPIVAQIYFEWRLGSGMESHVTKLVRPGQESRVHGEICWCYAYSGENQEKAKYYGGDGFFYANGFSWFPENVKRA